MGTSFGVGLLQKILLMLFLGVAGYSTVSELNHPGEQSARVVLADADGYATINLRPGISQGLRFKRLLDTFTTDPNAKDAMGNVIADFENKYGIDLEDDVIPWLGPEIALSVKMLPAPDDGAMFTLAIGTFNKTLAQSVLDKLLQPEEGRTVSTEEYRGLTVATMTTIGGGETEYFVLTEQYALVAFGQVKLDRFKANIDLILDGGPSFWDNADFQSARNALPEHVGMGLYRVSELIQLAQNADPSNPFWSMLAGYTPQYVAVSFTPLDHGVKFDFYSPTAEKWSFISDQVNPLASVSLVPDNAFGLYAGQNIKAWWDETKNGSSQANAQFARDLKALSSDPKTLGAAISGLYVVEGASMEPGFHAGDYLLVLPVSQTVVRSDVVLFTSPSDPNLVMLKRVVGLPGETLEVKDGIVFVNGTALDEPYVSGPAGYTYGPIAIPSDQYFLLGDSRGLSNDSHNFGPVSRFSLLGKVIANLDTDIMNWMTGEFAIAGLPGAGQSMPAGVGIFQVSDPALVGAKISQMIAAIQNADQPIETYQDTIASANATMIRWDGQEIGGYLFINNFLVAGSSREALGAALEASQQPESSIVQSPRYRKAIEQLPASRSGLLYADPASITNLVLSHSGVWERENYFRDSMNWVEPFQGMALSYLVTSQNSTATMVVQIERLFTTHAPFPNPESDEATAIQAQILGDTPVQQAKLVWSRDGVLQPELDMFDDGANGDHGAGDGLFGVQIGPFPPGTAVAYQVRAMDADGNVILAPNYPRPFTYVQPFVAKGDVLLVVDSADSYNAQYYYNDYYREILSGISSAHDFWNTGERGVPDAEDLAPYVDKAVIWSVPYGGYLSAGLTRDQALDALQSYLDSGGSLLISGRDIATDLRTEPFLSDYLHARFVQDDVGYNYSYLSGVVGDPITNGLRMYSSWGWNSDEIDPLSPATTILTYDTSAPYAQQAQTTVGDAGGARSGSTGRSLAQVAKDGLQAAARELTSRSPFADAADTVQSSGAASQSGPAQGETIISTGTAGLRVDTGAYKLVYLAFNLEGISPASDRANLLGSALNWLDPALSPVLTSPKDATPKKPGTITFSWKEKTGATGYHFQVDYVDTFSSPGLVEADVATTQYSANMSLGAYYWRVKAAVAGGETLYSSPRRLTVANPVVQVTSDNSWNYDPAIAQTLDGKLWVAWARNSDVWYKTSSDLGATWSTETNLTNAGNEKGYPAIMQANDGRVWVVWQSFRSGNPDLWYRTSSDNGTTWSPEAQLTSDAAWDEFPAITQTGDGKIWVLWDSDQSGSWDLWYKTSTDNGNTWSTAAQLVADFVDLAHPGIFQAQDGKIWVVWWGWEDGSGIWYKTSDDGGQTWSVESQVTGNTHSYSTYVFGPSIGQTADGRIWLAWQSQSQSTNYTWDVWYKTSANGTDWSPETQFTRFLGADHSPALTPLAGAPAVVWASDRSGNSNIWLGVPGSLEDTNPPPILSYVDHTPRPNPDSTEIVTVWARAFDESGILSMSLVWSVDGTAQADVKMWDDGTHGDRAVGDGEYAVQIGPFAANAKVDYQVKISDNDGNTVVRGYGQFTALELWAAKNNVLLVVDTGDEKLAQDVAASYRNALAPLGVGSDLWETRLRGAVEQKELGQYLNGAVIWATPKGNGYLTPSTAALRAYLDEGGRLFASGRYLYELQYFDPAMYNNYLHAKYIVYPNLYRALGVPGSIASDLSLDLLSSGTEIDPVAPAVPILKYDPEAISPTPVQTPALQSMPTPAVTPTRSDEHATHVQPENSTLPGGNAHTTTVPGEDVTSEGIYSSGSAGITVDSGTYRVVYLAFGFESVTTAASRALLMEKTFTWLAPELVQQVPPVLMSPADGSAKKPGVITFAWQQKNGATGYRFQLDKMNTFDSPALVDVQTQELEYSANLTMGVYYWRVQASLGQDVTDYSKPRKLTVADPVIQVTSDLGSDDDPAMVYDSDGKLHLVWSRNGDIWYKTSSDQGNTWSSELQLTTHLAWDINPTIAQGADGRIWVTWHSHQSGNADIWYKSSSDNGISWSPDTQLTTDPGDDVVPSIYHASDGKIWVVWQSSRSGGRNIWYKTSTDNAATWSPDLQLTTSPGDEIASVVQTSDGSVWVVWNRDYRIWYKKTTDGGLTWSGETQLTSGQVFDWNSSIAQASDGKIWVAWQSWNFDIDTYDIRYKTSADGGVTWSADTWFTRFIGGDNAPSVAALPDGRVAFAWNSDRAANGDIWFGIPGSLEDVSPPPILNSYSRSPYPNPDSDQAVTITARGSDETGIADISLAWSVDGTAQADLQMWDDGTHGDSVAVDGEYAAQIGPFPAGTKVQYQIRITDVDGNVLVSPQSPSSFESLAPWAAQGDVLLVVDGSYSDIEKAVSYYKPTLDVVGLSFDVWTPETRGAPDADELGLYLGGAVIWAIPSGSAPPPGYPEPPRPRPMMPKATGSLRAYLQSGGRLFITGRSVRYMQWEDPAFYQDYLHAEYVGIPYLYRALGAAGEAISDGLSLDLALEGAEIDLVSPATAIFGYDPSATAKPPAAQALLPHIESSGSNDQGDPASAYRPNAGLAEPGRDGSVAPKPQNVTASGISSSGTAGLKVDTGTYKVVYLAFDFGAITTLENRATTMEKIMDWLAPELIQQTPPIVVSPPDGVAKQPSTVIFTWAEKSGATGYRFQLDNVDSFNSPTLTDVQTQGLEYSANLTMGVYYWRVQANLGQSMSAWSKPWKLTVANPVIPLTTDLASDYSPAIAQASDGKIWVVWSRNGQIWYKTSSDNGTIWSTDTKLTTDSESNYAPAITQTSEGRIWVAWYSYRSGSWDIWYRTSSDSGTTWLAEGRITTDPATDAYPAIAQSSDGRVWVTWQSSRSGSDDVWYKTSSDGGITWSADTQLTTDQGWDQSPSIIQAADGKMWVTWGRNGIIWYKTSSDNGISWSGDALLIRSPPGGPGGDYDPSITKSGDGKIWVAWYSYRSGQSDIWYRTSSDNGTTWSPDTKFTRFTGYDSAPSVAALSGGRATIAWQSDRAGNYDIWFGIPGALEDVNPPPHLDALNHARYPNPTSNDSVTVTARASDENGVADRKLVWSIDKFMQPDLVMYDDGTHGDKLAGDNVWTIQAGPFAAGSVVEYQVRVTDIDGNSVLAPSLARSFKSLVPWVSANDVLLVVDTGYPYEPDPAEIATYYTSALQSLKLPYDYWDVKLRGTPDADELMQYRSGLVIWSMPYDLGYLSGLVGKIAPLSPGDAPTALQTYLDAGGRLFMTGQNIAQFLGVTTPGKNFLQDYLHASWVNGSTGLYRVNGVAGDSVAGGLSLSIFGGDGANNQYSTDEINPIAPAVPIFTYDASASSAQAPSATALMAPLSMPEAGATPFDPQAIPGEHPEAGLATTQDVTAQGIASSGTAGLRVDTGNYKVVYLSFGFEAISTAADRANLMGLIVDWLNPRWSVKLMASGGGLSDLENYAGVDPDASEQYDVIDVPEPPPPDDFVRLYFPHGDWTTNPGSYTRDVRPRGGSITWDFEVATSFSGNVTLTWDVSQVPAIYTMVAIRDTKNTEDKSDDTSIDMHSVGQLSYNSVEGVPRRFQFVVSTKKTASTTLATGWNLFSLPLDADPADWTVQLGDNVSPLYLFWYDPVVGGYKMWASGIDAFQPQPGAGYWIKAASPTPIVVEGYSVPDTQFVIHLKPGWNMIGQPFDYAVDWGEAKVSYNGSVVTIMQSHASNWVMQYTYGYDPAVGGYSFSAAPDGQLDPWKGYWVKSLVEADLIVPNKPMPSSVPSGPPVIPASHVGRTTGCSVCHSDGIAGAPKWPVANPDHGSFASATIDLCLACHKKAF